jgi:hypothetical protein
MLDVRVPLQLRCNHWRNALHLQYTAVHIGEVNVRVLLIYRKHNCRCSDWIKKCGLVPMKELAIAHHIKRVVISGFPYHRRAERRSEFAAGGGLAALSPPCQWWPPLHSTFTAVFTYHLSQSQTRTTTSHCLNLFPTSTRGRPQHQMSVGDPVVLSYHDVSLRQSEVDLLPSPNWFNDQAGACCTFCTAKAVPAPADGMCWGVAAFLAADSLLV